jgi:hypothetical protein
VVTVLRRSAYPVAEFEFGAKGAEEKTTSGMPEPCLAQVRSRHMPIRSLIFLVVAVLTTFSSVAYAQRAVLLIRHADRLDQSEDSPLSPAGEERAQRLAGLLKV